MPSRYPDDVRERALEVMRVDGLSAAHHATSVPKPTLSRWAGAAGIDFGPSSARTRTGAQARAAQLEGGTVDRLEYVVELASRCLIRTLEASADVSELDDDLGRWSDELGRFVPPDDEATAARALRRQQLIASAGVPVRDLSMTLTRAVHDLELLRGNATQRGEIVVHFDVPRPAPSTAVVVLDPSASAGGASADGFG